MCKDVLVCDMCINVLVYQCIVYQCISVLVYYFVCKDTCVSVWTSVRERMCLLHTGLKVF